jgi:hypothetical protein
MHGNPFIAAVKNLGEWLLRVKVRKRGDHLTNRPTYFKEGEDI